MKCIECDWFWADEIEVPYRTEGGFTESVYAEYDGDAYCHFRADGTEVMPCIGGKTLCT